MLLFYTYVINNVILLYRILNRMIINVFYVENNVERIFFYSLFLFIALLRHFLIHNG